MQGGGALVDGGHYTLYRAGTPGEPVVLPDGRSWTAATTPTTRAMFRAAAHEVVARRAAGDRADLALLVGDLALPAGERSAGAWGLPPSYREELAGVGLAAEEVVVLGEAFCRNQGKRRLLDDVRRAGAAPERTYETQGWALVADPVGLRLVSDVSLDWDAEVKAVALTRGTTPLCPLVFAGLKRWAFTRGYAEHVAIYALTDDAYIDSKLRAGATAAAQLLGGRVGPQVHHVCWEDGEFPVERLLPDELVAPGERPWAEFWARAQVLHPGLCRIEEATWTARPRRASGCETGSPSSPCSG